MKGINRIVFLLLTVLILLCSGCRPSGCNTILPLEEALSSSSAISSMQNELNLEQVPDALPHGARQLHTSLGMVTILEYETSTQDFCTQFSRSYQLYNGDQVAMERLSTSENMDTSVLASWHLSQAGGTVRWFDISTNCWQSASLEPMTLQASCIAVTDSTGGETMLYTPKVYKDLGSGTLQHLPQLDGSLVIEADGNGFTLSLTVPQIPAGCLADWTIVESRQALMDWAGGSDEKFWSSGYALDGDGKWCFDGYYFPSPTTYAPTGDHCYYRLPAAYLVKSLTYGATAIRAAEDLAVAMLDTMGLQQNSFGYFPTLPESQWLRDDYGISGGFYDTRFNTELALIFEKASRWIRCEEFDGIMNRYFDFFVEFAASHHEETNSGGWLVADYFHPDGSAPVHTSLNHQLAEILALYRFSKLLDREDLAQLADRMSLAIQDTAANWICPDNNLHYAWYPNGTYGGVDYPYLTYNDLYNLREYLAEQNRSIPELQTLMDAKLQWMQASGVTGYLH